MLERICAVDVLHADQQLILRLQRRHRLHTLSAPKTVKGVQIQEVGPQEARHAGPNPDVVGHRDAVSAGIYSVHSYTPRYRKVASQVEPGESVEAAVCASHNFVLLGRPKALDEAGALNVLAQLCEVGRHGGRRRHVLPQQPVVEGRAEVVVLHRHAPGTEHHLAQPHQVRRPCTSDVLQPRQPFAAATKSVALHLLHVLWGETDRLHFRRWWPPGKQLKLPLFFPGNLQQKGL
mmetsp:Transcript_20770/g.57660  ORF Transcript_20770/g.57660 Transcript_20770/m.57660 type:complete len:234 (+) Transcript_20770:2255-2956(+)